MKNKISILLISSIIIFFFIGCYTLGGSIGVSSNIKESKKRDVFIGEYEMAQNPYYINDSIKIDVDEMWLEKSWAYGSSYNKTIEFGDDYQLILSVKGEETFKNYTINWYIGINGSRYFRSAGRKIIVCDFELFPQDTISIPVQRRQRLGKNQEKDIFGIFEFHRK